MNWLSIGTWLWKILTSLVGIFSAPKQTEAESLAKEAGSSEALLSVEEKSNVEIQKASDAGDAVANSVQSADGLRKYEQSDPNNRHDP